MGRGGGHTRFSRSAILYGIVSRGGGLVPSLPVGVSEIWMEMGVLHLRYGYPFKIARHYGYNIYGSTEWLCAPPCNNIGKSNQCPSSVIT